MNINSIRNTLNINYTFNKNNKKQTPKDTHNSIPVNVLAKYPIPFLGKPRVDKRLPRFENFNDKQKRLTTTLKEYLATVEDKLSITPSEAMKNAYDKLNIAKSIKEVQKLFPNEELFIYLTTLKDTISKRGIIGIYKDFEECFKNGILKSGEDFTVYLLRKLFIETKVYNDINTDLDNDLIPDIKNYFRGKYNSNEYVTTEVLKGLGIYPPDQDMRNSLKFTKDGYSDLFGLTISISLLSRLNKLSEEEKEEEIINRSQGLEDWWNDLTYDEKLELVTGIDSQDEVYQNYRKYANANRKTNRLFINSLPEFAQNEPKKKVKTKIKLNDKELFVLWMQRNLAKYFESLSDEEKEILKVKRSKRQAERWQKMSPEEKTEYINKIRAGLEPLKFAMIDAWNHSRILIRTLSEFLKEHQVYKPIDMLYSESEFSEFQSRIMTEFWAANKDLAIEFGKTIKYAHQKIEDAMKNGTFEELKKQISEERENRIKILAQEYQAEAEEENAAEEAKKQEKEAMIQPEDIQLRKEFTEAYRHSIDKYNILPNAYINGMAEIMLDRFPKDIIIRYGNALKNNESVPQDVMDFLRIEQAKNDAPKAERLQRTLEAAIAAEMTSKGTSPIFFQMESNTLIPLLEHRYADITVPKNKKIDKNRILRYFNEFNRDLSDNEANTIANTYFAAKRENLTSEENLEFEKYLNTYGRSLFILFSDKSVYSDAIKNSFNEKFLRLMPNKIKEYIIPFIQTPEDLQEENEIKKITNHIYKRFRYLPDDILKIYTREISAAIRCDRDTHENDRLNDFKNKFFTDTLTEHKQTFPGILKKFLPREEIFKFLAIEEAMADEFFRVTKNENAYSREFAELLNFYDMTSIMNYKNKQITLLNEDGTKIYDINEKPNTKNLYIKYVKYLNAIKSNEDIINNDGSINKEELLYSLNPLEDKPERDAEIMKRINNYFDEQENTMSSIKDAGHVQSANTTKPTDNINYKKEFRIEYYKEVNRKKFLPRNYITEMEDIILETLPKETIEEYVFNPSSRKKISNEVLYQKCSKENLQRLKKIQHALETAIAAELVANGADSELYNESIDTLIEKLEKEELGNGLSQQNKININRIQELYNEYKRDLTISELSYIVNSYFTSISQNEPPSKEDDEILMNYIKEYGRIPLILIYSNDTTIPLKSKMAFNEKFLRLMPQKVKNVAMSLIQTEEDIKDNHTIEMIRKQIAKRFDFIPANPLNTYTHEAATVLRLSRLPDIAPDIKENYNIDRFKESLAKQDKDSDEITSVLRIPKHYISLNSSKLKLLAIEQAMADELYRVSKNNIVYKYEFEDLALWFELSSPMKKGAYKNGLKMSNADNDDSFIIKSIPEPKNIIQKYIKYIKEFEASDDSLYEAYGKLNKEEILYCLNPNENMPERDEYTKERIDKYFTY